MTDRPMPPDIDPESGNRLPLPDRDQLDAASKRIFDQLYDPSGGSLAGLQGPGGIRLHSSRVSEYTRGLNQYLRQDASFSGAERELAILVTAREFDSQFEWAAHEPAALKEGVSPQTVEIVRLRKPLDGLPGTEATIVALGREMFAERRVSSATFATALAQFGAQRLVELVSLMGQYAATAALLTAFDMQLRPGQEPRLP